MTLKEKLEIAKKADDLSDKAFELMEKNELAKELWKLCLISDKWTLESEELENCKSAEIKRREELKQEYVINKKNFYELFISIVKNYGK